VLKQEDRQRVRDLIRADRGLRVRAADDKSTTLEFPASPVSIEP
jgi:hypothetical protein